jgi:hypothetical protein
MPPQPVFVTTHIHTDGPIPGPHSLLTLTSAAHPPAGIPISTFAMNVRELPGATLHPGALQRWRRRPEDWLASHRASRPPATAMTTYLRWVDRLPGEAVFVADNRPDNSQPDYLFLYWYLQRFTGRWPFASTLTEPSRYRQLSCTSLCPLAGCRISSVPLAKSS